MDEVYKRAVKGLGCCIDGDCEACPYADRGCRDQLMEDAQKELYRLHAIRATRTEAEKNGIIDE